MGVSLIAVKEKLFFFIQFNSTNVPWTLGITNPKETPSFISFFLMKQEGLKEKRPRLRQGTVP